MTESDAIQRLCDKGGFYVTFETIVTLHQCALFEEEGNEEEQTDSGEGPPASLQWDIIEHGMPVIIANSNGVVLCLADVESGDKLCEFNISSASQYTAIDDHFHVFTKPGGCFGLNITDGAVGEKIMAFLNRVVPYIDVADPAKDDGEVNEPSAKQRRVEEDNGEEDETDMGFFHKKKEEKKRMDISEPKDFQHISHVGNDTSISQFTQALSWTDTLQRKERIVSQVINVPMYIGGGSELSTSFEDISKESPAGGDVAPPPPGPPPPAPPPPPAIAPPPSKVVLKKKSSTTKVSGDLSSCLAEELKKGVVLRPVSDDKTSYTSEKSYSSLQEELKRGVVLRSMKSNKYMTLPLPPKRNESEKLLFEIKTFRRKKLRRVSKNMTDFPSPNVDEKSLEFVMKKGFSSMLKKMSSLGITNIGSVTNDGVDNFDNLFSSAE